MIRGIILLMSILVLNSCFSISKNIPYKSVISPDGKYVAISFIRSSGATTSFSPQVTILRSNKKLPNKMGNVFIGNHSRFVDIFWKNENILVITHDCMENNIFKKLENFKNINIEYIRRQVGDPI